MASAPAGGPRGLRAVSTMELETPVHGHEQDTAPDRGRAWRDAGTRFPGQRRSWTSRFWAAT